jgi:hypothetical protein
MAKRRPKYEAFPPGDHIREEIEYRGWSQGDLAPLRAHCLRHHSTSSLMYSFPTAVVMEMSMRARGKPRSHKPYPDARPCLSANAQCGPRVRLA